MGSIDKVCEDIISSVTNSEFAFEKKAEAKEEVTVAKKSSIPENINLTKIAAQIREELEPKALTYNDLNSFIGSITRG